jgi:hypothetical protein
VLALLYGEGEFEKTMNYACMAGYDADNQCATLAGLVAIIQGSQSLPPKYTHAIETWERPLNDFYKNRTRDNLPDGKLTDMAERTAKLGVDLVVAHGGRVEGSGDQAVLIINPAARFTPPLEVRLYPIRLQEGEPVTVKPEIIGGDRKNARVAAIAGVLPVGLEIVSGGRGQLVLTGTPQKIGDYVVEVRVEDGKSTRTTSLPLFVREKNLALSAAKVLAAVTKPTGTGSRDRDVLRDEMAKPAYDSFDGENTLAEDFYGYEWEQPVSVGRVKVQMGPVFGNGGWFENIAVQCRSGDGAWTDVQGLRLDPPFNIDRARRGEFRFEAKFQPVVMTAIRIVGKPGGSAAFTSIAELSVHEK